MAILSWVISGFIIGVVAKLLMPGKDPGGIVVTIALGIAGAFVGSYAGQVLGMYQAGQPAGWIMSILGAVVLLWLFRMFNKKK